MCSHTSESYIVKEHTDSISFLLYIYFSLNGTFPFIIIFC